MSKLKLPEFGCKRCNHKWIPRKSEKPIICPKCKSPYWDKERIKCKSLNKN